MSFVEDNHGAGRFELWFEDGQDAAAAYYCMDRNRYILTHTIVPEKLSGQGIGSQLARGVFDEIRASGRKAILVCPFMTAFYARHPEYADIVEGMIDPREKA